MGLPTSIALVLLVCVCHSVLVLAGGGRHKRIVGGEPASPPPPGASEAENIVENPVFASEASPTTTTTTTTRRPAPVTPSYDDDGPIVFMRRGRREARVRGRRDPDGVYSFQGLRYAEPPVNNMRFQRPKQAKPKGEINATRPGPPCPQIIGNQMIGSEDCLFLNVYSPEVPKDLSSKRYPVLFWIHGGGFRRGSGLQYNGTDLVKKGLVLVTIQYRLGSLGFLSTNRKELPGNAGLFDIVASLKWVRHYIKSFGGDNNRIIVGGQGSGASAATMLSLATFTRDWIKGVFAMSGSAISSFAVDKEPEQTAREVSAIDSCNTVTESLAFVRCMQKLSLDTLLKGDDKVEDGRLSGSDSSQSYINSISKLLNPGPAVEGEDDNRFLVNFLTKTPDDAFKRGDFAPVPLLTGVTKHETSTSAKGGGIASRLLGTVTEELLEKTIPQLLNINSGLLGNTLGPVFNKLLTNNLGQLTKGVTASLSGMASVLDKFIEMTTDALFNLPAFLTSQYWSQQSKAYLYSFEHESQLSTADDFLQEHPLTDQTQNVEGVGHGDDLVYLFDVNTVDGQPIEAATLNDPADRKVRDEFTNMVAEFARTGEPKLAGQTVKPFTTESGDYMVISSTPSLAKGFRKCQMGLWAGLGDVLKSSECSFLNLGTIVNSLKGLTEGVTNTTAGLTNTLGLGGLTGGNNAGGGLVGGLVGGNKVGSGGGGTTGGLGGVLGGGNTGGLLGTGGNTNAPAGNGGGLGGLLGGNRQGGSSGGLLGGVTGGSGGNTNAASTSLRPPAGGGLGGLLGGNRQGGGSGGLLGGATGGSGGNTNAASTSLRPPAGGGLGGLLGGNRQGGGSGGLLGGGGGGSGGLLGLG